MKKLIVYYSYSGNCKKIAVDIAKEDNADIVEITEVKRPGKLAAYTLGCFKALNMKPSEINPVSIDLLEYDNITIISPIWAGHTVPAINAVFDMLPPNKEIVLLLVSAGGQSSVENKIKKIIADKDCKLISVKNIKS